MLGHPNVRVIGGLVGYSSNLTVINVTSNVSIDCRHSGNGHTFGQALGGVVGKVNTFNVSFSSTHAFIQTDAVN